MPPVDQDLSVNKPTQSFCEECLDAYTGDKKLWFCPLCRAEQNTTYDKLPRNYFAENAMEEKLSRATVEFQNLNVSKKIYYDFKSQVEYQTS